MKRPRISLPRSLGHALGELAIIVAGVLIALGAQSWWEGRLVDEDRRQTMGLLHDDLARLEATLRDSASATRLDSTIHRLVQGRDPEGGTDLDTAVGNALFAYGYRIGSRDGEDLLPAYSDLKSSGRLGLLPASLRARMPGIELQLVVLSRNLEDLVFFQQEHIDRILIENFSLSSESMPDDGGVVIEDPERIRQLLSDPVIRNLLLMKSSMLRSQTGIWRETADSVAAVRSTLDSIRAAR